MAFYDEQPGAGPVSPMAGPGALAAMIRRRRRPAGMGGPGFRRKMGMLPMPGQPRMGQPIDPGFEIQPGGAADPAVAALTERMRGMAQDEHSVTWGGKTWQDPNKLWGWIAARGGGIAGNKKRFYEMHPDAARRLGVPIEGDQEAQLFDVDNLKRGLVGQLTQAEGALAGSPVQGIHRVANNRMRAVGAAQGRAAALAQVMQRRLRGRARY